jgi:multidrug efflux pump subunit AcrB
VDRLAALGLTPADVIAAIRAQNVQAAIGRIGGQPMTADRSCSSTSRRRAGCRTPEEFGADHHPRQSRRQRCCGCATWRGWSSARQPDVRPRFDGAPAR